MRKCTIFYLWELKHREEGVETTVGSIRGDLVSHTAGRSCDDGRGDRLPNVSTMALTETFCVGSHRAYRFTGRRVLTCTTKRVYTWGTWKKTVTWKYITSKVVCSRTCWRFTYASIFGTDGFRLTYGACSEIGYLWRLGFFFLSRVEYWTARRLVRFGWHGTLCEGRECPIDGSIKASMPKSQGLWLIRCMVHKVRVPSMWIGWG